MAKSVVRIAGACVLALLASCQLNDHDSAPRAPDPPYDDSLAQDPSPAEADNTRGPPNNGSSISADAGTNDDNLPPLTGGGGDAAVDAGSLPPGDAGNLAPGFPPVPLLDAGTLPQGNFGTQSDGATIPLPPGF